MQGAKSISLAAFAGASLLGVTMAHAAYEVHQYDVPITYNSATTQNIDFDVAGHDPSLGTLQSISLNSDLQSGAGALNWTLKNNTGSTLNNERIVIASSINLMVKSNNDSLTYGAVYGYDYSDQFTIDADQSHTYTQTDFSAGNGITTSSYNSDFNTAGNVTLRLNTGETAQGYPDNSLTFTGVTGSINADYYLTLAYKYQASAAPASTPITVGTSATGNFDNGQGIDWYSLNYTSGELNIDTLGSNINSGGDNDTTLGLYDSSGNLVDDNDDGNAPGFTGDSEYLSLLHFYDGELPAGTYYIAVTGYGVDYTDTSNFNVDPRDEYFTTGPYRLNVNHAVPEPASLALLGLGGVVLLSRKRRGAQLAVGAA